MEGGGRVERWTSHPDFLDKLDQCQVLLTELYGATALGSAGYVQPLSFRRAGNGSSRLLLLPPCCSFLPQILSFILHLLIRSQESLLHSKFPFQEGVSFNGLIQAQLNPLQRFDRGLFYWSHVIVCLSSFLKYSFVINL